MKTKKRRNKRPNSCSTAYNRLRTYDGSINFRQPDFRQPDNVID